MRLLLVTEADEFSENLKKVCGQEHQLGRFLTADEYLLEKGGVEFDCALCDRKYFSSLKSHFQNPILIITSTDAPLDWVATLNAGANGVVFTDVAPEGTLAQILAYLNAMKDGRSTRRYLPRFGMMIDLDRYEVEMQGKVLDLTLTELKVLKELANGQESVIPRMAIQQQVFGQLSPGNRSLDVHICSLRKKLRPHSVDIESVRGVGYRLIPFGSARQARTARA